MMRKLRQKEAEKEKKESLLLSQKSNFEKIAFYLLILFLPTQFGKHFWPEFSQVLGIRIDYLSPTLYFTDLLILLLFLIWAKRCLSFPAFLSFVIRHSSFVIFFLYLILNIIYSNTPLLGIYGLIKIFEMFFLATYVAKNIKSKKELGTIAAIFSIAVIGESFLAITQYIHQGSINGFLYFLGERRFTSITPGIANASINGELILRPYGTFPHPNVLAGFLLCSLIFIFGWIEDKKNIKKKILKISSLLLGSLALFLTLSRIAIMLWFFIAIIIVFRLFFTRLSRFVILLPTGIIVLFIFLFFTPILPRLEGTNFTEEAFSQRADLFKSAQVIIKDHPLFGVGLLNFLPALSHIQKPISTILYLQPVHNIFLLITAEIGIIGLAFFLWFLFKTYNRLIHRLKNQKNLLLFILLSVILILGLFDHYWLTLQQGQLLFTLILGLIYIH